MSLCVGSLRWTPCVPGFSSTSWILAGFCSQKLCGLIFLALEPWAGGSWCGSGTPCSWNIPPKFLSTTHEWGTSPFCIFSPPTSLDGCGFFSSVVVRLPFNWISAGSEWWLLYISVVILMWLCEEASHVCLRCHLDRGLLHFNCIFLLPFIPLISTPPQESPHCYSCLWVLYCFCSIPSPLTTPELPAFSLSMHLSLFCLFHLA